MAVKRSRSTVEKRSSNKKFLMLFSQNKNGNGFAEQFIKLLHKQSKHTKKKKICNCPD
jgi:hypothetical protein